jgi:hypothetical protein
MTIGEALKNERIKRGLSIMKYFTIQPSSFLKEVTSTLLKLRKRSWLLSRKLQVNLPPLVLSSVRQMKTTRFQNKLH